MAISTRTGKPRSLALQHAVWGFVVGDALGVPYEFFDREVLKLSPCSDMSGYGTHQQPAGTWSDDSSMMLCVLENLLEKGSSGNLVRKFLSWYIEGYMTANGLAFDVGNTTRVALERILQGIRLNHAGLRDESCSGNGTLMRCLPYAFGSDLSEKIYHMVLQNKITHSITLCHECCIFYVVLLRSLSDGYNKNDSLKRAGGHLRMGWRITNDSEDVADIKRKHKFSRLFKQDFHELAEAEISSTGYVLHTLEAAVWCFMNGRGYKDTVLKAVNLGGDTDTIAALAGGLAAVFYGFEDIPAEWIAAIQNKELIEGLLKECEKKMY